MEAGARTPLARHLPLALVAGLLFVVAWGLIDAAELRRPWREERLAVMPVGTVPLSLEWAILLSIASVLIVRRAAR